MRLHLHTRTLVMNAARLAFVALLLAGWQLGSDRGIFSHFVVSSPEDVWRQLDHWFSTGSIWTDLASTMGTLAIGYALGLGIGLALGLASGVSITARAYLDPFLTFFNALPRLILIPVFIVWLGFGATPKVLTVFSLIVVYIALTVSTGVRDISADLVANTRALGARRIDLLRDVYVAGIAIWIIASARVAIGLAFQGAIVTEFFGSPHGLGYLIEQGLNTFNSAAIYAALVLTAVIAFAFDRVLAAANRKVTRWLPSSSGV